MKIKVLMIPHAGASAQVYKNKFKEHLASNIEIVPIELPGRTNMATSKKIKTFDELVQSIIPQIKDIIENGDTYVLFGYSMGGNIVYELYYELLKQNIELPKALYFASSKPPEIPYYFGENDVMTDEDIIGAMKEMGGTDEAIFQNKQLLEVILQIVRTDFEVLKSYKYNKHEEKIKIPMIIQAGELDTELMEKVKLWDNYTDSKCEYIYYNEGHFFADKYTKEMAEVLNRTLKQER